MGIWRFAKNDKAGMKQLYVFHKSRGIIEQVKLLSSTDRREFGEPSELRESFNKLRSCGEVTDSQLINA